MSQFPLPAGEHARFGKETGRPGLASETTADRCPFSREFRDGQVGCSTFEPVIIEIFDSTPAAPAGAHLPPPDRRHDAGRQRAVLPALQAGPAR